MMGVRVLWPLLAILLLSPGLARAGVVEDIQTLLRQGDAPAAYALAGRHAADASGEPEFDFWLGMAALADGHPDQAVFAFERVLLLAPGNHRARLELGRAYYRIGDFHAAQQAFTTVLDAQPPVNVRQRVEVFLDAIERQQQALRTRFQGSVLARAGYDSNINSATSDPRLEIPALGVVELGDASLSTEDQFLEIAADADLFHPLTKFSGAFANVALKERNNFSSDTFDLGVATVTAGLLVAGSSDRVRLPVTFQKLTLSDTSYRNLSSVGIEWTHQWDPRNQWGLFAQAGAFRYAKDTSLDVNLKLAGAAWTHQVPDAHLVMASSVYVGDERAVDGVSARHNGKDYLGVRLGAEWQKWQRHVPYGSVTYQSSEYDADHPVFATRREDDFLEARLGWIWKIQAPWSVRAEFSYVKNDSTLDLYEYDRRQLFAEVRYEFE